MIKKAAIFLLENEKRSEASNILKMAINNGGVEGYDEEGNKVTLVLNSENKIVANNYKSRDVKWGNLAVLSRIGILKTKEVILGKHTTFEELYQLLLEAPIGTEIETDLTSRDEIKALLYSEIHSNYSDKSDEPYTTNRESEEIYEIAFMLKYKDWLDKEIGGKIMGCLPMLHPEGEYDDRSGSIHIHYDPMEFGEVSTSVSMDKASSILEDMEDVLCYTHEFRNIIDEYEWCDGTNSKCSKITLNSANSSKKSTIEIRLNEVAPLWMPMYLGLYYGYTKAEIRDVLRSHNNVDYKYLKHILEKRSNIRIQTDLYKEII